MRRWTVLAVFVTLAILDAGFATAGARHMQRAVVICPQHPGLTTCCGPPIQSPEPYCCPVPTTTGCPPALSITATPNPITAGATVTISGAMIRGSGAGQQIALWQRLPGGRWKRAGHASTDAAGDYSIKLAHGTVMTNRKWYVAGGGIDSSTLSEGVAAAITLAASRNAQSATVYGHVTPSHRGERVLLQRLVNGAWVTIAKPQLDHRSGFAVHYAYAPHVKATLRAVLGADSRNIRSVSRTVTAVAFPVVTAT
jgi:hypothetical protein